MTIHNCIDMAGKYAVHVTDWGIKYNSERCLIIVQKVVDEDSDFTSFEGVDHFHLAVGKVSHLVAPLNLCSLNLANIIAGRHFDAY